MIDSDVQKCTRVAFCQADRKVLNQLLQDKDAQITPKIKHQSRYE